MLLNQQTFYRKYGVRMLPQVMAPAMHDLKLLEFPREAIYHYLPFDGLTEGPPNDDPLLRNVKKAVPIITPLFLTAFDGHPVRLGGDGTALVRDYFKTHRRMRKAMNIDQAIKDKEVPVVVNFAPLTKLYRYQNSIFARYWRWRNLFTTFLNEFTLLSHASTRQHYVFLDVPKTLPAMRQLIDASKEFNQHAMKVLREPSSYLLLELWKWFCPGEGEPSLFAQLPKDKIHLLNFVFIEGGKWCVINFGVLNSFFLPEGQSEPDPEYVIQAHQHVTGVQMGKRVLRMYMSLMEARSDALKFILEQQGQAQSAAEQPQIVTEQDVEEESSAAPATTDAQVPSQTEQLAQTLQAELPNLVPALSIIDEEEFENLSKADFHRLIGEQDAEINQDLHQLEEISVKLLQESTHESLEEIVSATHDHAPEHGVTAVCERLATTGSISAAEYRKFTKAAQSYKELKAPVGGGTLEQFLHIAPEKLKITESETMPDAEVVIDKTMLKSSLNLFDSKYVGEVLHKDVANTVMAVQKAGVAVTGYRIDKVEDILGGYEEHVVRLNPVIGQPSTLRFKVPVIREDGSYVTNGVKYRLRKQRGD